MKAFEKPFFSLTVGDLMSRHVVTVPEDMSLVSAARLLAGESISGAPVVDADGRCVGVLSATDYVWRSQASPPPPREDERICEWQMIDLEKVPGDSVCEFMTRQPVTASPTTSIARLAEMMRNAHIHRVIVVDADNRPIGIVTSTDILAAVAQAEAVQERREDFAYQEA